MSGAEALERLKAAVWLQDPDLRRVFAALDAGSGATRVVGGAVRDTLIGMSAARSEVDLATVLAPDEVTRRAKAAGLSAIPTGIAFGTVTLVANGTSFEVTTLRRDVETDGRHAVVSFGTDWAEDARRRDFTLNALYCGPDGDLFDPLGGLDDCLAGRVRFIGDAATRIAEDRLRVFRFFRFSASHGGQHFDQQGLAASADAARSNGLSRLSAERIGHEMSRILSLGACATTLEVMTRAGVLDIDAAALKALARYERREDDPALASRLVLLAPADGLKALQKRWRLSNALIKDATLIAEASALVEDGKLAEAAYRFAECRAEAAAVAAARDDATDKATRARLMSYEPPAFPVSGALLMRHGHARGPELGALLKRLEAAWIDSEFTLTRSQLLEMAAAGTS